ncbi:MAG: hypothetical protein NVS3B26_24570 [Mycobacteriales bacterium]
MSPIRELFAETDRALGALDIVVLNAGSADGALIADQDATVYDDVMAVNARGTFSARKRRPGAYVRAGESSLAARSIRSCGGRAQRCTPRVRLQ